MPTTRRTLIAGSAAVATGALIGAPAAASAPKTKPTIVLVHGAFADASGWNDVARSLQCDGYRVIAPANPLRDTGGDAAYIASVLASITGPVVLVGHSYGGFVNTNAATAADNVKALVYVAAVAPDEGETVQGLQLKYPGSKLDQAALDVREFPGGFDGYVKAEVFREVFAGDLPRSTTDLMHAGQRPGSLATLGTPSGAPAWKSIPSYYLVARNDQLIPPAVQRFMAARAGAHTVEVNASHVAMISQPRATADLIRKAAR